MYIDYEEGAEAYCVKLKSYENKDALWSVEKKFRLIMIKCNCITNTLRNCHGSSHGVKLS